MKKTSKKVQWKRIERVFRHCSPGSTKARIINIETGHVYKWGTYDEVYAWLCSRKNKSECPCPYEIHVFVKNKKTGVVEQTLTYRDFVFFDEPLKFVGFKKGKKK